MEELEKILKHLPTSKPASPDPRAQNQELMLRSNVTYIVAGVVVVGDKVLLIQEAKPSCRGDWYLPAGRMEANETIVEAVKREVEEESGLTFEPEAVIAVECPSFRWIRVTLAGKVTGGSLKTTAQADKESLQAGWFSQQEMATLNLRARDILPLIEVGRKWSVGRHYGGIPVQVEHVRSSLRLISVARDNAHTIIIVAKSQGRSTSSFPSVGIGHNQVKEGLKDCCGYKGPCQIKGVLSLEHVGHPNGVYDGVCLSLLVEVQKMGLNSRNYQWAKVESPLQEMLAQALDNNCAQLLSI